DTSAPQMFTITVNAVNDPPSFTVGPNQTVNEDAGPQTVNPWATAISPGPPDESGQTVTFNITGNTNPALFSAGPAVSPTGVLTYTPAADAFGTATITLVLVDNGGGGTDTSAPQMFTITVNAVNDPPSFTVGPNQTVNEDAGPQTVNPWATAISPGPPDESGQTVTFNITGNTNPALFSAGPAVSPTGVLTYTSAANAFGTATITLVLVDNGGGTDTSAPQMFTITVNAVPDAPTCSPPPGALDYATPGNTQLHAGGATPLPGVASITDPKNALTAANATDVDGPPPITVVPFSGSTAGGTWNLSSTGSFTFVPNAGFTGTASLAFQVQDGGGATGACGTISVAVGPRVWYIRDVIDADNPSSGDDGRSTNPFDSIAEFNAATTFDGDIIF